MITDRLHRGRQRARTVSDLPERRAAVLARLGVDTEGRQRRGPLALLSTVAFVVTTVVAPLAGARPASALGVGPVPPPRIVLIESDLQFILDQIQIAEAHAAMPDAAVNCPGPAQGIAQPTLPYGLRTVDGSCNNLFAGQSEFGAADNTFPRLVDTPDLRPAELGTSYNSTKGLVFDSHPRVVTNLIADQSASNPAAVSAAGPGAEVMPDGSFLITNTAPDGGLSAPYNSWFTLFGQFFDHGLDLINKGGSGTVLIPLKGCPAPVPMPNPVPPGFDNCDGSDGVRVNNPLTNNPDEGADDLPGPDGVLRDNPATLNADEGADDLPGPDGVLRDNPATLNADESLDDLAGPDGVLTDNPLTIYADESADNGAGPDQIRGTLDDTDAGVDGVLLDDPDTVGIDEGADNGLGADLGDAADDADAGVDTILFDNPATTNADEGADDLAGPDGVLRDNPATTNADESADDLPGPDGILTDNPLTTNADESADDLPGPDGILTDNPLTTNANEAADDLPGPDGVLTDNPNTTNANEALDNQIPEDTLYVPGSLNNVMRLSRASNLPGPDGVRGDVQPTGEFCTGLNTPVGCNEGRDDVGPDPGPDGILGDRQPTFGPVCTAPNTPVACDESLDDIHEHTNQTTPWIDQNQTYTSHPSHQVFLREYVRPGGGAPVATGHLLDGVAGGIANWEEVKAAALANLNIQLVDTDVFNVPLLDTDPYGRFVRGANGFPRIATTTGFVEADGGPLPANTIRTGHAFLDDIAHNAAPDTFDLDGIPGGPRGQKTPDGDDFANPHLVPLSDPSKYDDELLAEHFVTGDGRGNENIGLTAVHHVFHSEHNGVAEDIAALIPTLSAGFQAEWNAAPFGTGERLFQAARFVTEMQYQHLVFEEFARKMQPLINVFAGYDPTVNPSISAEYASAVYRFGHSMLNEDILRYNGADQVEQIDLFDAFLNPVEYTRGGAISADEAAGQIIQGMTRQTGNELDEFVTGALRNNLLATPLDLGVLNIARGRESGLPRLNELRRQLFAESGSALVEPYANWNDFGANLRHGESLVNFIAAYGTGITGTVTERRAAAAAAMNDAGFMSSPDAGIENIDLWMGGLAEKPRPFFGMLGSTFNHVFETQLEALQDHDRFYYLFRLPGTQFAAQIEQNSFAKLIQRNTTATQLPGDVFARVDFTFYLNSMPMNAGASEDDPSTLEDETGQINVVNGAHTFAGIEHVVIGGTNDPDNIVSSEGDDTLWGDQGGDRLAGGDGNDQINGGPDNDIITDTFGDDVLKGDSGNDALQGGSGFDLLFGGSGHDFVVGGQDPKETFSGTGNDFINAGDSADIVFANEGDDWIEGGGQADLLQGDNGAPFQDGRFGNDVVNGDGGNDDYDSEGGDDIMLGGTGTERFEGMLGFDWVTNARTLFAADFDLRFTGLLPPDADNIRDRFDNVQGVSGYTGNDILRGDSLETLAVPGGVNQGLTAGGLALIDGLAPALLPQPPLGTPASAIVYDTGNILLGGGGSDILEGRGGNDRIDGDRWLNVVLTVDGEAPGVEYTRMVQLQSRIFSAPGTPGHIDASMINIVRRIETSTLAGTDTVQFTGPQDEYDLFFDNGELVVDHARGTLIDGTDRLTNVEQLTFCATAIPGVCTPVTIPAPQPTTVSVSPAALADFGARAVGAVPVTQDVVLTNTGTSALNVSSLAILGGSADSIASFSASGCSAAVAPGLSCTITVEFAPTAAGALATALDINSNAAIPLLALTGAGVVNTPATGTATISDTTPTETFSINATPLNVLDPDGVGALSFQWEVDPPGGGTVFQAATGAGAATDTYTPVQADVGGVLRVALSFVDTAGTLETLLSAPTTIVGDRFPGTAGVDTFAGTAGEDLVNGGDSNDNLAGAGGNDIISGDGGNDVVNGGAGIDQIRFNGTADGFDAVTGGTNADTLVAMSAGTDIGLTSLASSEVITANGFANVRVVGSAGNNTLNFGAVTLVGITEINGGEGVDIITGSAGVDNIIGGLGTDTLAGGASADTLEGGAANDTLTGGGANDFLVYRAELFGDDLVNGFDAAPAGGQDLIDIRAYGFTSTNFTAPTNATDGVVIDAHPAGGTRVTIRVAGVVQGTLRLAGVAVVAVNSTDFRLA